MTNNNIQYEDEIDLRELFNTIIKNKKLIIILTSVITILAIIFVLLKTPIYEAKALIEIGSYKTNNNLQMLDNSVQLSHKLNILYIDLLQNKKDRISEISSIKSLKKSKEFIEIKSLAISNKLAKQEINKVIKHIQSEHDIILKDINKKRSLEIKNINNKIDNMKNVEFKLYEKNIKYQEKSLENYKNELKSINAIIKKIQTEDSSLTALKLMEKSQLLKYMSELEVNLFYTKDTYNNLKVEEYTKLLEDKNKLESLLLSYNYKNSQIVGEIIVNDYPIKPKKKLIVIVAFITALILSIFLVFFLEFIKAIKEKKQDD